MDDAEEFGQAHLLAAGEELFAQLISRPIRRVSRHHNAPLSLEKIQVHLIGKWKGGVRSIARYDMEAAVESSGIFGADVEANLETSLESMGNDWKWMSCPVCMSSYI